MLKDTELNDLLRRIKELTQQSGPHEPKLSNFLADLKDQAALQATSLSPIDFVFEKGNLSEIRIERINQSSLYIAAHHLPGIKIVISCSSIQQLKISGPSNIIIDRCSNYTDNHTTNIVMYHNHNNDILLFQYIELNIGDQAFNVRLQSVSHEGPNPHIIKFQKSASAKCINNYYFQNINLSSLTKTCSSELLFF